MSDIQSIPDRLVYPRLGGKKKGKKRSYRITEPITSYGLLLYSTADENIVFLLYQRRDNFEYMDFLKGAWGSEGQLPALFSVMSHEERERIRNYTFKELWDDLWVEHTCRIYRDSYTKAKKKYDSIKDKIPYILETTQTHILSPPWGFPKGKKNGYYEDPVACALREFEEETRIPTSDIQIVEDIPFTENFRGSNGKAYATHYYLAKTDTPKLMDAYETPQCIRKTTISEEASDVRWFTYEEATNHLNPRRQSILRGALEIIEEYERKIATNTK